MKKRLWIGIVICLLLALLCGAAVADTAATAKSRMGMSKVSYVDWLYGPTNLQSSVSGMEIKLTWNADSSGNADGYVVYQCWRTSYSPSEKPLGWTTVHNGYYYTPFAKLGTTSNTGCTIEVPEAGSYHFEVDSYYISPSSYICNSTKVISVTVNNSSTTVGAPTSVTAKQTASNKVKLTWTAGTNAKSYVVYRATGSSYTKIGTTKNLSFTDKKATNGKTYKYKVMAKNGSKKAYSDVVKATPMAKPGSVKAKYSSGKVTVSWKKVKAAKKYLVYQKAPGESSFSEVATVTTNKAKISVSGNGTFKYYVIPYNGSFAGLKSAAASVNVSGNSSGSDDSSVTYRAVLIGMSYENCSHSDFLEGCAEDNAAMKNMLSNLTGTKYDYIKIVKDGTESQIMSAIRTVFGMADDNDVTLLHYSGHGVYDYGGSFQGALVAFGYGEYITPYELRSTLDNYKGSKVILLDSCFSGTMIGKGENSTSMKAVLRQNNASFIRAFYTAQTKGSDDLAASGYYVMTASSGSQESTSLGQNGNWFGVFTKAFTTGCGWDMINQCRVGLYADTNGDSKITFNEAYKYSKQAVDEMESDFNSYYGYTTADGINMDVQVYPTECSNVFFAR